MRPMIGIPCDHRESAGHMVHLVGDKYVRAAAAAGGLPVLIPAVSDIVEVEAWLERIDALILTGSPSNIQRHHYGLPPAPEGEWEDPDRDALTLEMIRRAVARDMPFLGICRGLQELNVALGGTLHPAVEQVDGRDVHHLDLELPKDELYGPTHSVALTEGGRLAEILQAEEIMVNSIHFQGVDRLAEGLVVEAVAPDGQIEAARVERAGAFQLAVQWHPEWKFWEFPQFDALIKAFGASLRR